MDDNDKVLITQLPFAQLGVGVGGDAWIDRKNSLLKDLANDLPIRKLRASRIDFEFVPSANGVRALVYMVRTSQLNLGLSGKSPLNDDPFSNEVAMIRDVQKQLHERYQRALKSSVDPRDEPHVISRRRRLWKHRNDGHIWIPSRPEGEKFEFSAPSMVMPHASKMRLRFEVKGMYKRDCRIVIHEVVTPEVKPYLRIVSGRVQKVFRYDQALGETASRNFAYSIDKSVMLEAAGQIVFSWVDSSVERISLTGLPIPL